MSRLVSTFSDDILNPANSLSYPACWRCYPSPTGDVRDWIQGKRRAYKKHKKAPHTACYSYMRGDCLFVESIPYPDWTGADDQERAYFEDVKNENRDLNNRDDKGHVRHANLLCRRTRRREGRQAPKGKYQSRFPTSLK